MYNRGQGKCVKKKSQNPQKVTNLVETQVLIRTQVHLGLLSGVEKLGTQVTVVCLGRVEKFSAYSREKVGKGQRVSQVKGNSPRKTHGSVHADSVKVGTQVVVKSKGEECLRKCVN